jgi:hypothetical protein
MERENIDRDEYTSSDRFLGIKRESRSLKDNYIFRRILTGRVNGKYEAASNSYYNMFAFNWDDEKLVKTRSHPCKHILTQ